MDYADGGDLHQRIHRTRQAGKLFTEERIVRRMAVSRGILIELLGWQVAHGSHAGAEISARQARLAPRSQESEPLPHRQGALVEEPELFFLKGPAADRRLRHLQGPPSGLQNRHHII